MNFSNEKNSLWNYYPSYQEYVDLMTSFADSFPNICKLHSLGTLSSGREILIVQISDNVGIKENGLLFYILLQMEMNFQDLF